MFGRGKREKEVKVKKEKRRFFKRKNKENIDERRDYEQKSYANNQINIDINSVKERIKRELVKEVSSDFIYTLKEGMKEEVKNEIRSELKNDIKSDVKREFIADRESLTTKFFTTRVKNEIKSEIIRELKFEMKEELRKELFDSLKKDILFDIKIAKMREDELKRKLKENSKAKKETNNLNNNPKEKIKDDDLIKNFLSNTSSIVENIDDKNSEIKEKINLNLDKKNEPCKTELNIDKTLDENNADEVAYTKTEFLTDAEYEEFDVNSLNANDDFFTSEEFLSFNNHNVSEYTQEELGFKDLAKKIAKEQGENIKKASDDVKKLSIKGYNLSREEINRIRSSEAYKKYVEKIKNINK